MNAAEFDERFDAGEDVFTLADLELIDPKRLNVVFPEDLSSPLKEASARLGVPFGDLVRQWVSERLAALAPVAE